MTKGGESADGANMLGAAEVGLLEVPASRLNEDNSNEEDSNFRIRSTERFVNIRIFGWDLKGRNNENILCFQKVR